MAIFRVTTQKRSTLDPNFTNVYYMSAADSSELGPYLSDIVAAEQTIHGSTVNFYNVHWENTVSSSFGNVPFNVNGSISASTPIKPFICAKVTWGSPGSYNHYKMYRVQVGSDKLNGTQWVLAYQSALEAFAAAMVSDFDGILVTKTGTTLSNPTSSDEYWAMQTSKRWHNRASS